MPPAQDRAAVGPKLKGGPASSPHFKMWFDKLTTNARSRLYRSS